MVWMNAWKFKCNGSKRIGSAAGPRFKHIANCYRSWNWSLGNNFPRTF